MRKGVGGKRRWKDSVKRKEGERERLEGGERWEREKIKSWHCINCETITASISGKKLM